MKKYDWHRNDHDKTPYGITLATKIADYLMEGGSIVNTHRDYCGMGLLFENNKFVYGAVYDGYIYTEILSFTTKNDFIAWLSTQNDYSMSGHGEKDLEEFSIDNQRITKYRLENLDPLKKE